MFRKAFLALLCVTSLMAPAPLPAGTTADERYRI
jgi:hypothetical protein